MARSRAPSIGVRVAASGGEQAAKYLQPNTCIWMSTCACFAQSNLKRTYVHTERERERDGEYTVNSHSSILKALQSPSSNL